MWSLVNISKGQQLSLILCVLCLIDQWSCHGSAQTTNTTNLPGKNDSAQLNVTSPLNALNISVNASASTENSTIKPTTVQQSNSIEPTSELNHAKNTSDLEKNSEHNERSGVKSDVQGSQMSHKAGPPKVLIALIVSGLCLAAIILVVYKQMNKRTWSPQSKRLRTNQMHMRSQN
ncbi:uncharacterized protein LOC119978510 isoform X2 [Scyliorhinus canicula]|uniref:uncharacterized protein LOC119978510 isoform X2 n=1 Tax=Scyliorhinus canicula TaxID=7830 RepID=UPI0018F3F68E|nr:uncharacterized protein LOC119978510 isoform X2 [Scyliorhinus canicula]